MDNTNQKSESAIKNDDIKTSDEIMTRGCTDPWTYLEVTTAGRLRPCCRQKAVGDVREIERIKDFGQTKEIADLRSGLLRGDLDRICQSCHIRKLVPIAKLNEMVENELAVDGRQIKHLRIDITGRCNLRCSYCAVTAPNYQGIDLHEETFPAILEIVDQLAEAAPILVNGHGETTFHPKWVDFCNELLRRGRKLQITTNLAKSFSDQEIETLACFDVIQVSADSHDDIMMKEIRKPVTWTRICANKDKIDEAARQMRRDPPIFSISAGIYHPSIWSMRDFVEEALKKGFSSFTFWNLIEHKHNLTTRALLRFDNEESKKARAIIFKIRDFLNERSVPYHFAGDFFDKDGQSFL